MPGNRNAKIRKIPSIVSDGLTHGLVNQVGGCSKKLAINRAGVAPGPPVVTFAREIASRPGLRFAGVAGWESQATTIADPAEKERTVRDAVAALTASARACTAAGYSVAVIKGTISV